MPALDDAASQLREQGVAVLRDFFPQDALTRLNTAAARCFESIQAHAPPAHYQFNRFSHSLLLTALTDFGCSEQDLLAPLSHRGLALLFATAMGCAWRYAFEQSWLRKKFAPSRIPDREYHPHVWHQDGALGVRFPAEPGPVIPMTRLLTCWIPLTPCGTGSPGLEFVRRPLAALLHYTELDDAALRHRFAPEDFWAPPLVPGDGLVFLNGTLHRTYTTPEMPHDRLSVEYRLFPR